MANSTNVPTLQFTSAGLVVPSEPAILAGIQADQNAMFGGNLNPALNTPQGQLATTTTAQINNGNTAFATLVDQVDPDNATGFMQDAIGRFYFINRLPAVATVVNCLCTGAFGTPIPVGALVQDTSGNIYSCTQAGEIPVGGSITLPFANIVAGPTPAPANTLTIIYAAISGWDVVNNPTQGATGSNVESPAAFEYRREQSVAKNGSGSLPAVYAACWGVAGVLDVFVTQNNTPYTNPNSINRNPNSTNFPVAPNSLYVAVVGGLATAVTQAIWKALNAGCAYQPTFVGTASQAAGVVTISAQTSGYIVVGMTLTGAGVEPNSIVESLGTYNGTTGTVNVSTSGTVSSGAVTGQQIGTAGATLVSELVQDTSGYSNPIPTYQVTNITPVNTPIFFAVELKTSTLLPANIITLVQTAIVNAFNGTSGTLRARCAAAILASQFYAPVLAIGSEVQILSIEIGFTSTPASNELQMGIDQEPTCTTANVAVTFG